MDYNERYFMKVDVNRCIICGKVIRLGRYCEQCWEDKYLGRLKKNDT